MRLFLTTLSLSFAVLAVGCGADTSSSVTGMNLPSCQSVHSDPDGDGFGFENGESCFVDENSQDIVDTTCIDSDGDGFGWNGAETCTPVPTIIRGDNGETVLLEPARFTEDMFHGISIDRGDCQRHGLYVDLGAPGEEYNEYRNVTGTNYGNTVNFHVYNENGTLAQTNGADSTTFENEHTWSVVDGVYLDSAENYSVTPFSGVKYLEYIDGGFRVWESDEIYEECKGIAFANTDVDDEIPTIIRGDDGEVVPLEPARFTEEMFHGISIDRGDCQRHALYPNLGEYRNVTGTNYGNTVNFHVYRDDGNLTQTSGADSMTFDSEYTWSVVDGVYSDSAQNSSVAPFSGVKYLEYIDGGFRVWESDEIYEECKDISFVE